MDLNTSAYILLWNIQIDEIRFKESGFTLLGILLLQLHLTAKKCTCEKGDDAAC